VVKAGEVMALFPLFVDLTGKSCVIIGGGGVAARKADALLEFGARITVVSPKVSEKLRAYAVSGRLQLMQREYCEGDLDEAFLVIAATSDRQVNEQVYREAVRRNIPVNTVDNPEFCSFIFPALVKRGELVVGITTSGHYPALSAHIREEIEELFSPEYGKLVEVLKEFRLKILMEVEEAEARKELLYRLLGEITACKGDCTPEQLREHAKKICEGYGV
jgi:precorrin-2 dehydrogenase / sirohydrochlorin ferrochelatase